MIKHVMMKLFISKYRRASAQVEQAKKLIQAMTVCGSLSSVKR